MPSDRQHAAFDYLLQQFAASATAPAAQRWRYLEAAHVLVQNRVGLHLRIHWCMRRYALEVGDAQEARGQWRHMAYALWGSVRRRVPQGNNGRALVHPLRTMVPTPAVRSCITEALQAVTPAAD